jgi:endonuclease/exonuclease/phosphatase (EEP) superfamily protein YafD
LRAERLNDEQRTGGLRNTNDAGSTPLQRIDYVWHSAGLVALTAGLGQAGGSDHLPVVVRIRLVQ